MVKFKSKTFMTWIIAIVALFSSVGIYSACLNNNEYSNKNFSSGGTSQDVIQTQQQVENSLINQYGSLDNFNMSGPKKKVLYDCENLSQNTMNYLYNNNNGTQYTGTCAEVAATLLAQYYDKHSSNFENRSYTEIFEEVLNDAIANGYFVNNGTFIKDCDKIVRNILISHNDATQVQDDYYGTYDTLVEFIDQSKPTLFQISGHTMVGVGYLEYTITYTQTKKVLWWTTTETVQVVEKFAIVNDGWSNASIQLGDMESDVYSYFPADLLVDANVPAWLGDLNGATYFNVVVIE